MLLDCNSFSSTTKLGKILVRYNTEFSIIPVQYSMIERDRFNTVVLEIEVVVVVYNAQCKEIETAVQYTRNANGEI